jgi:hypothetical protein
MAVLYRLVYTQQWQTISRKRKAPSGGTTMAGNQWTAASPPAVGLVEMRDAISELLSRKDAKEQRTQR